ncbi:MAG: PAS domain-containing sensor histidine kinase [Eubacterium sp.]|nr:PAS domain-containing sensor histidine kinase [Eubacterium sp.]MCM1213452.1 PAS domain-containing sensor histidine kinase [Lachnospiraceae bacterium]MCM1303170.1 PAS domain-containing sensor histidine kinase [Butyrivibrio sp.]MCM1344228.1 PAS domain-containing sensor histidine kinase [Muribaculaceae bacterium]MCM1240536.1 PAS domain-containing sensor histidine kinase [Lachnospiraceae bacterium]
MLIRKMNLLPSYQKHILDLSIFIFCMTAAMGISCLLHEVTGQNAVNTALLFIFFLIIVSCCTTGYLYGIIYCLLTILFFSKHNIISSDYPITFSAMLAITVFVSTMASHMTLQTRTIAEREKLLSETGMEKMRADLLRAISHDMRTPLTGIIGNSAAFLENQARLSEQEKTSIVTSIYEDSSWLISMVENLLSVTRVREQALCINTREESVEEVVEEALRKMAKRHPGYIIHARIPDEFILLPMDALLIEQVVINLLENALYHAESTKPVNLIVEDLGGEVAFTVRDYGVGIPREKLRDLFDRMEHTDPHFPDSHKGMGIGLAICRAIITAHHGTLTGKNHECGASFTFTLPKTTE